MEEQDQLDTQLQDTNIVDTNNQQSLITKETDPPGSEYRSGVPEYIQNVYDKLDFSDSDEIKNIADFAIKLNTDYSFASGINELTKTEESNDAFYENIIGSFRNPNQILVDADIDTPFTNDLEKMFAQKKGASFAKENDRRRLFGLRETFVDDYLKYNENQVVQNPDNPNQYALIYKSDDPNKEPTYTIVDDLDNISTMGKAAMVIGGVIPKAAVGLGSELLGVGAGALEYIFTPRAIGEVGKTSVLFDNPIFRKGEELKKGLGYNNTEADLTDEEAYKDLSFLEKASQEFSKAFDSSYWIGGAGDSALTSLVEFAAPSAAIAKVAKLGKLGKLTGKLDDVIGNGSKMFQKGGDALEKMMVYGVANTALEAHTEGKEAYKMNFESMQDEIASGEITEDEAKAIATEAAIESTMLNAGALLMSNMLEGGIYMAPVLSSPLRFLSTPAKAGVLGAKVAVQSANEGGQELVQYGIQKYVEDKYKDGKVKEYSLSRFSKIKDFIETGLKDDPEAMTSLISGAILGGGMTTLTNSGELAGDISYKFGNKDLIKAVHSELMSGQQFFKTVTDDKGKNYVTLDPDAILSHFKFLNILDENIEQVNKLAENFAENKDDLRHLLTDRMGMFIHNIMQKDPSLLRSDMVTENKDGSYSLDPKHPVVKVLSKELSFNKAGFRKAGFDKKISFEDWQEIRDGALGDAVSSYSSFINENFDVIQGRVSNEETAERLNKVINQEIYNARLGATSAQRLANKYDRPKDSDGKYIEDSDYVDKKKFDKYNGLVNIYSKAVNSQLFMSDAEISKLAKEQEAIQKESDAELVNKELTKKQMLISKVKAARTKIAKLAAKGVSKVGSMMPTKKKVENTVREKQSEENKKAEEEAKKAEQTRLAKEEAEKKAREKQEKRDKQDPPKDPPTGDPPAGTSEVQGNQRRTYTDDILEIFTTVNIKETDQGKVATIVSERKGSEPTITKEIYSKETSNEEIYKLSNPDNLEYSEIEQLGKEEEKDPIKEESENAARERGALLKFMQELVVLQASFEPFNKDDGNTLNDPINYFRDISNRIKNTDILSDKNKNLLLTKISEAIVEAQNLITEQKKDQDEVSINNFIVASTEKNQNDNSPETTPRSLAYNNIKLFAQKIIDGVVSFFTDQNNMYNHDTLGLITEKHTKVGTEFTISDIGKIDDITLPYYDIPAYKENNTDTQFTVHKANAKKRGWVRNEDFNAKTFFAKYGNDATGTITLKYNDKTIILTKEDLRPIALTHSGTGVTHYLHLPTWFSYSNMGKGNIVEAIQNHLDFRNQIKQLGKGGKVYVESMTKGALNLVRDRYNGSKGYATLNEVTDIPLVLIESQDVKFSTNVDHKISYDNIKTVNLNRVSPGGVGAIVEDNGEMVAMPLKKKPLDEDKQQFVQDVIDLFLTGKANNRTSQEVLRDNPTLLDKDNTPVAAEFNKFLTKYVNTSSNPSEVAFNNRNNGDNSGTIINFWDAKGAKPRNVYINGIIFNTLKQNKPGRATYISGAENTQLVNEIARLKSNVVADLFSKPNSTIKVYTRNTTAQEVDYNEYIFANLETSVLPIRVDQGRYVIRVNKQIILTTTPPVNKSVEPSTETIIESEVDTKIADIERRRQEELNTSEKVRVSRKVYKIKDLASEEIYEVEVTMYANGSALVIRRMNGEEYQRERVTNKAQIADKNILLGLKGSMRNYGEKTPSIQTIAEIVEEKEVELGKSNGIDKINAKYDAELAALKGKPTEQQKEKETIVKATEEVKESFDKTPTIEQEQETIVPNDQTGFPTEEVNLETGESSNQYIDLDTFDPDNSDPDNIVNRAPNEGIFGLNEKPTLLLKTDNVSINNRFIIPNVNTYFLNDLYNSIFGTIAAKLSEKYNKEYNLEDSIDDKTINDILFDYKKELYQRRADLIREAKAFKDNDKGNKFLASTDFFNIHNLLLITNQEKNYSLFETKLIPNIYRYINVLNQSDNIYDITSIQEYINNTLESVENVDVDNDLDIPSELEDDADTNSAYEDMNSDQLNEDRSIMLNPKNKDSIKQKIFLSSIKTGEKNSLGFDIYYPIDTIKPQLLSLLALNNGNYHELNYRNVREIIEKSNYSWKKELLDKLDAKSEQFISQFINNNHTIAANFEQVIRDVNNIDGGFNIKILPTDYFNLANNILNAAFNNLQSIPGISIAQDKVLFSPENYRAFELLINDLSNKTVDKITAEDVSLFLEMLGFTGVRDVIDNRNILVDTIEFGEKTKTTLLKKFHTLRKHILENYKKNLDPASGTIDIDNIHNHSFFNELATQIGLTKGMSENVMNRDGTKMTTNYIIPSFFYKIFLETQANPKLLTNVYSKSSEWITENHIGRITFATLALQAMKSSNAKTQKPALKGLEKSDIEHLSVMSFFGNNGMFNGKLKGARYLTSTYADKGRANYIKAYRHKYSKTWNTNTISQDRLFNHLVLPDINRMEAMMTSVPNLAYYKPFVFYGIPELNGIPEIQKILTEVSENPKAIEKFKNEDIINTMKTVMNAKVQAGMVQTRENWKIYSIGYNPARDEFTSIDNKVIEEYRSAYGGKNTKEVNNAINDDLIRDYYANYIITLQNMQMLYFGDPAQYNTGKVEVNFNDISGFIKSINDNMSKRLAKMSSPATVVKYRNSSVRYGVIGDNKSRALNIHSIAKLLDSNMDIDKIAKEYENFDKEVDNPIDFLIKEYDKNPSKDNKVLDYFPNSASFFQIAHADAQELVHWLHRLDVLFGEGKIGPEQYNELVRAEINGESIDETDKKNAVWGAKKPLYVGNKNEALATGNMPISYYIKSSDIPLRSGAVKGTELEEVLKYMSGDELNKINLDTVPKLEDGRYNLPQPKIERLVFESAIKQGLPNGVTNLFDNDQKLITDNLANIQVLSLPSQYLGNQLEVPVKDKSEVTDSVQLKKLLFANIGNESLVVENPVVLDLLREYNNNLDEVFHMRDLKKLRDSKYNELYRLRYEKLVSRITSPKINKDGSVSTDAKGNPLVQLDRVKLHNLIHEEMRARDYDINERNFVKLDLNDLDNVFAVPLYMSANPGKFQSLIASLLNNNIARGVKRPGFGGVQASSLGTNTRFTDKLPDNDMIYVDPDFDGVLKFLSDTGVAQITLPWKYKDDIKNYTNDDNKTLDLSKFPKELLRGIGFRIPNQGHSSMLAFEVVGFSKSTVGNVVTVPTEIVTQMGSDFDVDKLYSYLPSAKIQPRNQELLKEVHDRINELWKANQDIREQYTELSEFIDKKNIERKNTAKEEWEDSEFYDEVLNSLKTSQKYDTERKELAKLLQELKEDLVVSSDTSHESKLYDDIFNIEYEVLSNNKVKRESLTPLDNGVDELGDIIKATTQEYTPFNKITANNVIPNYNDLNYQRNKFAAGTDSKKGTAAYSLLATFAGAIQEYSITTNYHVPITINGIQVNSNLSNVYDQKTLNKLKKIYKDLKLNNKYIIHNYDTNQKELVDASEINKPNTTLTDIANLFQKEYNVIAKLVNRDSIPENETQRKLSPAELNKKFIEIFEKNFPDITLDISETPKWEEASNSIFNQSKGDRFNQTAEEFVIKLLDPSKISTIEEAIDYILYFNNIDFLEGLENESFFKDFDGDLIDVDALRKKSEKDPDSKTAYKNYKRALYKNRKERKRVFKEFVKNSYLKETNKSFIDKIITIVKSFLSKKETLGLFEAKADEIINNFKEGNISNFEAEIKENYTKLDFQKVVNSSVIGEYVLSKLNPIGAALTGSLAYSPFGSVYRDENNVLHDIDTVTNKNKSEVQESVNTHLPGSVIAYDIEGSNSMLTYIVPPSNHTISNIKRRSGNTSMITGYDVTDKNGKVVGSFKLNYDLDQDNKVINRKEIKTGIEGTFLDVFYNQENYENSVIEYQYKNKNNESIAILLNDYKNGFAAKLKIGREKDKNDIALFKPEVFFQKDSNDNVIGQANIKAMTVLIDSLNQKEDTLPHEYAHHYIAWNREAPIVKEAIKKWGSEEALVQAIGEQAVKQEGQAWKWWKRFIGWLKGDLSKLSDVNREGLKNILTDAFLINKNLLTDDYKAFSYDRFNSKLYIDKYSELSNIDINELYEEYDIENTNNKASIEDLYKNFMLNFTNKLLGLKIGTINQRELSKLATILDYYRGKKPNTTPKKTAKQLEAEENYNRALEEYQINIKTLELLESPEANKLFNKVSNKDLILAEALTKLGIQEDQIETILSKNLEETVVEEFKDIEYDNLRSLKKPSISLEELSPEEMVKLDNGEKYIAVQSRLKQEIDDINSLINCIW